MSWYFISFCVTQHIIFLIYINYDILFFIWCSWYILSIVSFVSFWSGPLHITCHVNWKRKIKWTNNFLQICPTTQLPCARRLWVPFHTCNRRKELKKSQAEQSSLTSTYHRNTNKVGVTSDDDPEGAWTREFPITCTESKNQTPGAHLARYRCLGICKQDLQPTAGIHRRAAWRTVCQCVLHQTGSPSF